MTYHLSIEKTAVENAPRHLTEINNLLFGGNKGYSWMTQFLGLMHSVALEPSLVKTYSRQTVMTQYMLKLLTILSNILVTNLQAIDAGATSSFVLGLLQAVKDTKLTEISLSAAD